jgi:hypothetical protein
MATIVTLLVCVGALGMATAVRAQTVTPRLGAPPFAPGDPPRETGQQLYDGPDFQHPVGFALQDHWGMYHLLPMAAAESSAGGRGGSGGAASSDQADLAKKLQNPIADLISVPLQNNWDFGIGPADAMKYTVNIQPVIPVSLSTEWNLIIRTIMPVIYAESPVPGGGSTAGFGDITQSFFVSPKAPTRGGWIWGVGPVFLYPTASDSALGSGKFGLGPTAVALKQEHGWTYGMLFNHIWSVAGNGSRDNVSATFMQPFLTYTTKTFTTFGINTETTYDWEHNQGTVPINWFVQQLLKIDKLPIAFQVGDVQRLVGAQTSKGARRVVLAEGIEITPQQSEQQIGGCPLIEPVDRHPFWSCRSQHVAHQIDEG